MRSFDEIFATKYLLRWRFFYHGGESKSGMWSLATQAPVDMAFYQDKRGLSHVAIEGKDVESREVRTFVECPAHEFVSFKWVSAQGAFYIPNQLLGLTLITKTLDVSIYRDGSAAQKNSEQKEENF